MSRYVRLSSGAKEVGGLSHQALMKAAAATVAKTGHRRVRARQVATQTSRISE